MICTQLVSGRRPDTQSAEQETRLSQTSSSHIIRDNLIHTASAFFFFFFPPSHPGGLSLLTLRLTQPRVLAAGKGELVVD